MLNFTEGIFTVRFAVSFALSAHVDILKYRKNLDFFLRACIHVDYLSSRLQHACECETIGTLSTCTSYLGYSETYEYFACLLTVLLGSTVVDVQFVHDGIHSITRIPEGDYCCLQCTVHVAT